MIPILYDTTETAFTSNGIGRLTDCITCLVTEERNGIYELEATYPITGRHYDQIQRWRIIAASHDEQQDVQPFVIYRISKPIDGIVTINAHHVSYRLSDIIVSPISATSVNDAFAAIELNSMSTNPFTFWSDNVTPGTLAIAEPRSARTILGGQQGSILDVFGGEYEFDKFDVKNHAARGANNGVEIRYGKNLMDLNQDASSQDVYNAIVPYWADAESGTVVYGGIVRQTGATETIARAIDYSAEFTEQPTVAQLEAFARTDLENRTPWVPYENITINFVALWQMDEYKDIAPLERVQLCDTVTVIYSALGVQATAKVIKVVWNALTEKYDSIELGDAKSSFAQTIMQPVEKQIASLPTKSMLNGAINHATDLITGGLGGNVVIKLNANGRPEQLLIMDTDDIDTAVNVWRWSLGGLGHSHNGYAGPYNDIALTQDGYINASRILTGYLNASRIRGGVLQLGGADNGHGVLQVLDANDSIITSINLNGVSTTRLIANTFVQVDGSGNAASYIKMGLQASGLMELSSANGVRIQQTNADSSITKDVQLATAQITATTANLGANVIFAESTVLGRKTRLTLNTGGMQFSDLSGSEAGGLAPDGLPQMYSLLWTDQFAVHDAYVAGGTRKYVRYLNGAFVVGGGASKSKAMDLPEYGERLLYCYETPEPLFGDVGEGVIAEDGRCFVWLDPVFAGTIAKGQYQIFLQAYGPGDCYVEERAADHVVVCGAPGLRFGWELKAKQADLDQRRLDPLDSWNMSQEQTDYGAEANDYLTKLYKERCS